MTLSPAIRSILLANIDTRIDIVVRIAALNSHKAAFTDNESLRVAYTDNWREAHKETLRLSRLQSEVYHATEVFARF